jgi:hypothetical protein
LIRQEPSKGPILKLVWVLDMTWKSSNRLNGAK